MEVIALPVVAEMQLNEVAEMQLNFWKEKLPSVQVPETVAGSTSPLTQEEVNTFANIIKDGSLRFHAIKFCNSANLLCYESVDLIPTPVTLFRAPSELNDINNIFFPSKELREGGQITLPHISSPWKAFLPHKLSQMIPFATVALSDVLSSFGISERSNMAINMNMTLISCEDKPQKGEVKACTTSIKGMVEFVLSNLGSSSDNIELVFHPAYTADYGKKARVTKVIERQSGLSKRPPVACHRFVYPYGVFFCHSINGTLTYTLGLEVLESNGNMYNATALCHPNRQSKESVYNCHLFAGDSLLWLTKDKDDLA